MSFNRNDPADLAALLSEAGGDPETIGYTVLTDGDTVKFLSEINAKNFTVSKPRISTIDVKDATTYDAYNNLAIDEQEWLRWQTDRQGDGDNWVVTSELRQVLAGDPSETGSIWAAANRTEMNAAMLALMDVPGSRAEVLWGYGTVIILADWAAARDS